MLNRDGTTIVLVHSAGPKVPTPNNEHLSRDSLDLGQGIITPKRFSNLRIVRTSIDADKLLFYYPEQEVQWPVGFWNWEKQDPAWMQSRTKPTA